MSGGEENVVKISKAIALNVPTSPVSSCFVVKSSQ
jgi:hypothetical protein